MPWCVVCGSMSDVLPMVHGLPSTCIVYIVHSLMLVVWFTGDCCRVSSLLFNLQVTKEQQPGAKS